MLAKDSSAEHYQTFNVGGGDCPWALSKQKTSHITHRTSQLLERIGPPYSDEGAWVRRRRLSALGDHVLASTAGAYMDRQISFDRRGLYAVKS